MALGTVTVIEEATARSQPTGLLVPYGRAAVEALRDEIGRAQAADPLAPVTVVVSRPGVGLAVRRLLASGDLGAGADGRVGVIGVRFVTLGRLADELGVPALGAGGRLPLTDAVVGSAVRAALAEAPGELFAAVRRHPATVRALAAATRDVRGLPEGVLDRLAGQSRRAREVVRLARAVDGRLSGWFDERDVLVAATDAVRRGAVPLDALGQLVVYLPRSPTPEAERLVTALGARQPLRLVVGLTGEPETDGPARSLALRLAPGAIASAPDLPRGTGVVSAPSADAEMLAALRTLMARAAAGLPLERMAIAHSGAAPYPRLIRDSLEQAAIPFNGVTVRPLSATVAGRTLLGAFSLPDHDWRRDAVMAWISGSPLVFRGREVPATAWDDVSKEAGVVTGLDAWMRHLAAFADGRRRRLRESDGSGDLPAGRAAGSVRELAYAEDLAAFLGALADRLASPPRSWAGWARWATALLAALLGSPAGRAAWPDDEGQAADALDGVLRRLTVLDGVEPAPDLASFRAALGAELEAAAPQTARFGHGVLVARLSELAGLDLDLVLVVGMDDGAYPPRPVDDPLLPDAERVATGPEVPLRAVRATDARRDYLAALASSRERVLSFSRWDQGHGRVQRPSRWLIETAEHLAARTCDSAGGAGRLLAADVAPAVPGITVIPSYTAAVAGDGEPASPEDRDLRSLLRWVRSGRTVDRHDLARRDPVLRAGLEAARERRSGRFTRFDGRVERASIPSPASGVVAQSPTGLQDYAVCPRRYLLGRVLRVTVRSRPEAVLRIAPTDKGSLVHECLERYVAEAPDHPADDAVARIDAIATEVFATYEELGLVGRPVLWQLDRAAIRRDLRQFVVRDAAQRAATGSVPVATELAFGPADELPVSLDLPGGGRVTFKGRADRVDRAADGTLTVIDYKTGSARPYLAMADDPVDRGRRLQLPVYGLAARARFGGAAVRALYWFVAEREDYLQVPVDLTDANERRFADVVGTVVEGIESGCFPARPGTATREGSENCRFCEFDGLCPADRARVWERVREAPELSRYVALAEGPVENVLPGASP